MSEGKFHNIEEWAEGTDRVETLAVGNDLQPSAFSTFHPRRGGLERYGFTNENTKGSTSEHRASLEALQDAIRKDTNPFQIISNTQYVATNQDLQDAQYLLFARTSPQGGPISVYDAMVPSAAAPATTPPTQTTPPSTTPAPFEAQSDRQLLESIARMVSDLALSRSAAMAIGGISSDATKAVAALRAIQTAAREHEKALQGRPAVEERNFLGRLIDIATEGGA